MSQKGLPVNSKNSKKTKSYQGKMDAEKPFARITQYDLEEEGNENDEGSDSEKSVEEVRPSSETNASAALLDMNDSIGRTGNNVLKTALKNKHCLNGIDCCVVLAWKQGSGSALLKGKELKRFEARKQQKMVISKVCLAGAHLEQLRKFLDSNTCHLNQSQEFVEISADICSHICNILSQVAGMVNVDEGAIADYFNQRFADLRNRKNFIAK